MNRCKRSNKYTLYMWDTRSWDSGISIFEKHVIKYTVVGKVVIYALEAAAKGKYLHLHLTKYLHTGSNTVLLTQGDKSKM